MSGTDERAAHPRYGPAVLDHFERPRHAGHLDRAAAGVATGEARLPDGERLVLQVRRAADGRLREVRFKAFGCPVTIACGSWAAERLAQGADPPEAALAPEALLAGLSLDEEYRPIAELPARAWAALRAGNARAG